MLRPDLYPEQLDEAGLDTVDEARARMYLLLARLVLKVPDERLLIDLRRLEGDASPFGMALAEVARSADVPGAERIAREYFELFIGVGRGELLPYASYYLTGFLYERPLVRVRQDMRRLGIERGEGMSEPEDHIGFLMESMAGIVTRRFLSEVGEEKRFFTRHLQPWAERFFGDVAKADAARFYRAVGQLGLEFMRIEREAFALDPAADLQDDDHDDAEVSSDRHIDVETSSAGQGARA